MAITSAANAAAAYRSAATTATGVEAPASASSGFGDALSKAIEGVVSTAHEADHASAQALTGQGSIQDVIAAVARAELTLQTTVAIRDRVVQAYQDVMRMPI